MAPGFHRGKGDRHGRRVPASHPVPRPRSILVLRNRQQTRGVELRLLRRMARALLRELWPNGGFDLAIYLVGAPEMIRLNEGFLRHRGSTDVITFDYTDKAGQASRLSPPTASGTGPGDRRDACPTLLHGEIFVCVDEAVRQARRFKTTWQSELVRYIVHGVLHLLGYEDDSPRARRQMKTAEDALVRRLAGHPVADTRFSKQMLRGSSTWLP